MIDIDQLLHDKLTPEQHAAATATEREILALACAGSGKSRTLAYRIALLVANGAHPRGIVAFTFTEKAAESIKIRVAEALRDAGLDPAIVGAMYVGTIHGWCRMILGSIDAGYRQYEVLDDNRMLMYLMSRYPRSSAPRNCARCGPATRGDSARPGTSTPSRRSGRRGISSTRRCCRSTRLHPRTRTWPRCCRTSGRCWTGTASSTSPPWSAGWWTR